MANSLEIRFSDLNKDVIQKVLDVWVEVGGHSPFREVTPEAILARINQARGGDQITHHQLHDGYRFGSKIGSSKLRMTVYRDRVEFRCNDNAFGIHEKAGDRMRAEFKNRLVKVLEKSGISFEEGV